MASISLFASIVSYAISGADATIGPEDSIAQEAHSARLCEEKRDYDAAMTKWEAVAESADKAGRIHWAVREADLRIARLRRINSLNPGEHADFQGMASLGHESTRMQRAGQLRAAYDAATSAHEAATALFGEETLDTDRYLLLRAILADQLGEFKLAAELAEQSFLSRQHLLGPVNPLLAESLACRASCLEQAGDFEGALPLMKAAVELWQSEGLKSPRIQHAVVLLRIAGLNVAGKRIDHARASFQKASALIDRATDEPMSVCRLVKLSLLQGMAAVEVRYGDAGEAVELCERALDLCPRDQANAFVGGLLSTLAEARLRQGNISEARDQIESAMRILKQTVGVDHPAYVSGQGILGEIFVSEGKLEQADALFVEAIQQTEQASGRDYLGLLPLLRPYGQLLRSTNRPDEATHVEARVRALEDSRPVFD